MVKINGEIVKGTFFAYDNCHKIYIIEDEEDLKDAISCGYDIYTNTLLKEKYDNSCSLKFISNWKLDKQYARQFEDAIIEYV